MKMLWIICNESIGEELMERVLDSNGVEGYTVWRDVLGKDNVGNKTHWGMLFPRAQLGIHDLRDRGDPGRGHGTLQEFQGRALCKESGDKGLHQQCKRGHLMPFAY